MLTVVVSMHKLHRGFMTLASSGPAEAPSSWDVMANECNSPSVNMQMFESALSTCWQCYQKLSEQGLDKVPYHVTCYEPIHHEVSENTIDALSADYCGRLSTRILGRPIETAREALRDFDSQTCPLISENYVCAYSTVTPCRCRAKQRNVWGQALHQARKTHKPLTFLQLRTANFLLEQLDARYPQQSINSNGNGSVPRNLWIVKPAAQSRGRGIAVFRRLEPLLDYCDVSLNSKCIRRRVHATNVKRTSCRSQCKGSCRMWIVQKYIENQLLIANRKFDIRQWVLVTGWNPLTIWFYGDCYTRFSAAEYSVSDDDLDNKFVHLVNNSISKTSINFHTEITAENGVGIIDCMWTLDELRQYLNWRHQRYPFSSQQTCAFHDYANTLVHSREQCRPSLKTTGVRDVFYDHIQPSMKRIATWVMMCAQEHVGHRPNSWELYGFDFMLDSTGSPWLIEVNSSPACDYSTSVTESFVKSSQCT